MRLGLKGQKSTSMCGEYLDHWLLSDNLERISCPECRWIAGMVENEGVGMAPDHGKTLGGGVRAKK